MGNLRTSEEGRGRTGKACLGSGLRGVHVCLWGGSKKGCISSDMGYVCAAETHQSALCILVGA